MAQQPEAQRVNSLTILTGLPDSEVVVVGLSLVGEEPADKCGCGISFA
jgi:hypothetical protein